MTQVGYAPGELTLRVDPGEARLAYPGLSGFVIRSNGQEVARCSPDGTCPPIAAPNGEQRTYDAFAANSVGTSRSSVRTVAWAYDAPGTPVIAQVAPVVTSGEGGVVSLTIEGIDPASTGTITVSSPAGETVQIPIRRNDTTVDVDRYRVGSNTASPISVTPSSRFDLPPGLGGSPSGPAATASGNGVGAPLSPLLTLTSSSAGDGTSTVTARATAGVNGDGSELRYGVVREGQRCTATAGGDTATFPGLSDGDEYAFDLCVESWFDDELYGRSVTTQSVRAQQTGKAPQGYTFAVDAAPEIGEGRADWIVRADPTSTERVPNRNRVEFSGLPSSVFGRDPVIQVRYVHEIWGTATSWATATPRAGSAPYQVQASWGVQTCVGGSDLVAVGDSSGDPSGGKAAVSFGNAGLRYFDASGAELAHTADSWAVPVGAKRVEGIAVSVSWSAQGWGLSTANATFSASCDPNIPIP